MRKQKLLFLGWMLAGTFALVSCGDQAGKTDDANTKDTSNATIAIKEENVNYTADNATLNGFVVYDSNSTAKRPVVLVVHEWWGLNDYARNRARQLAQLGYLAMAVDMFGNGRTADNPDDAGALAGPFYTNWPLAKSRLHAALMQIRQHPQADTANIAAIGYCFGGSVVLNSARLGEDLKGVVSFHGNLVGAPADKNLLKAKILVCHGNADPMVSQNEVNQFKKQMDSIGADYTFKAYDSALHAFTNPAATAVGQRFNLPVAYNAEADRKSWDEMKAFLGRIFPK
jgi:dienelactone hydrolase